MYPRKARKRRWVESGYAVGIGDGVGPRADLRIGNGREGNRHRTRLAENEIAATRSIQLAVRLQLDGIRGGGDDNVVDENQAAAAVGDAASII